MRRELADLIHEAMEPHELARDIYHHLTHRASHQDTRETFDYLAQEAAPKGKLYQSLVPRPTP
jgi:hypothetical protein